uniref:Sugar phosphate phosphatase n=1 Tax=Ciona savignyi TaxID=51511 RepID=H2Y6F0_CIOSA
MEQQQQPVPLSASEPGNFVYDTMKDRVPRILTKCIDVCHKKVYILHKDFGEEGRLDCQSVIGQLSQLRTEIMTNKPLTVLDDKLADCYIWNNRFNEYVSIHKSSPSWFDAPWLYAECFCYRKIMSILSKSKYLQNFDVFSDQKKLALTQSLPAVKNLTEFLNEVSHGNLSDSEMLKLRFQDFLHISLWGNKCDLSLSGGEENSQNNKEPHKNLTVLEPFLLHDSTNRIFAHLQENTSKAVVDIILDNSGFELFTDLVFAEFLLAYKLATQVRFHPKTMPWFVSDVTPNDFRETINFLLHDESDILRNLASKWKQRLEDKSFLLFSEESITYFWTLPDPFCFMKTVSPTLHNILENSKLLIFKGDLNYRKLVSDWNWPHDTSFCKALRGFSPAPLCSLRTLKAPLVVGLTDEDVQSAVKKNCDWMVTGKYAVVQSSM